MLELSKWKNEGSASAQRAGAGILAQSFPDSVLGRIRGRIGPKRPAELRLSEKCGAEIGGLPTLPVVARQSSTRKKSSLPVISSGCSAAATIAASLLLPPWISRAVVYLSSVRYGESSAHSYNAASLREITEMATMAALQDLSVAAFASCFVLLPGMILAAGTSRTKRAPLSLARKVLAMLVGLVAYVLFIAPVWLDLVSQLLTGMRIRHEFVALTLRNFGMFSSSLESFYSNLYDLRVVVILLMVVWSFRKFFGAMYTLALTSPCSRLSNTSGSRRTTSPSIDSGAKHTTPSRKQSFRILGSTLRRYCARPLGLLLGLASMYTLINLAVMTSLVVSSTSTSSALHASNVVFLICAEALGVPYLDSISDGFLLPSSIGVSLNKGTKPNFVAPSERFVDWDPKYPFYRRTMGYQGPKAFDINPLPNNRNPNIVVIMLESWRHRDVGVLGGVERLRNRNRTATPNFDRLSQQGVLFDNFHGNGVQTSRTLMSTLFGTLPQFTTSAAIDTPTAPLLNMSGLPSLLKDMGYTTLFASATGLDYQGWDKFLPSHGFDCLMGLDEFEKRWHDDLRNKTAGLSTIQARRRLESAEAGGDEPDERQDYDGYNYTTLDDDNVENKYTPHDEHMTDDFIGYYDEDFDYSYPEHMPNENEPQRTSWGLHDETSFQILSDEIINLSSSEQPFFVDYYSISSHHPFDVPWTYDAPAWIAEEAGENNDYRKYLEVLSYTDKALGDFFDQMEEHGIMNETIFLVGGDHGFGFCDHKPCYDGMNIGNANAKIFDEVVRVPFAVVGGANLIPKPFRVHEAASQVDIMATAMDMIGIPTVGFPQHGVGRSLMRKVPIGMDTAVLQNSFNDMAMGLKVGNVKYIYEGNRMISVYNMSGKINNETSPTYSHRMEKGGDALFGAPRDILQVRDRIAKLLHDTARCYDSNTYMPSREKLEAESMTLEVANI